MCKTWVSNLKLNIEAEFAPFRKITSRWVVAEIVRNSLENSATQLAPFSSGSRSNSGSLIVQKITQHR